MIVTTGNEIAGRAIVQYLGIARGVVVRHFTTGAGRGSIKSLWKGTGEISEYSGYETACDQANEDAYRRMVDHATRVRADAIIGMRYDATEFVAGAAEVLAYGTAVKLSK